MNRLERSFKHIFIHERSNLYIVLEDCNFEWSQQELSKILPLWLEGWSLDYISNKVKRDIDEIALLIIDLGERPRGKSLFQPRRYGVNVSPAIVDYSLNERVSQFISKHSNGYVVFSQDTRFDFVWDERVLPWFRSQWEKGTSVAEIAKSMKRNVVEVALLILDQARQEQIKPRKEGLGVFMLDETKKTRRSRKKAKCAAS